MPTNLMKKMYLAEIPGDSRGMSKLEVKLLPFPVPRLPGIGGVAQVIAKRPGASHNAFDFRLCRQLVIISVRCFRG